MLNTRRVQGMSRLIRRRLTASRERRVLVLVCVVACDRVRKREEEREQEPDRERDCSNVGKWMVEF